MPREVLLTVNDHKGRVVVACDYNDRGLEVTHLRSESDGGTRTVAITDDVVTESRGLSGAVSDAANVRGRGWRMRPGPEGELLVPFCVQVF